MHDIRYDAVHDEFVVNNPFAHAILVFRGGADGEEAPIRVIQGPSTQLAGTSRLDVDVVNNEIIIPDGDRILVFPREGNGDVAPIRVIHGSDTRLVSGGAVAVDPVSNLIVIGTNRGFRAGEGDGSLLIYNRTDNGNVPPRRVIEGPRSGIIRINQIQIYSPKGWIVASQPGRGTDQEPEGAFVGIWSVNDNGDVAPRWLIGGPQSTLKKPRGVALNPQNKELIVADIRLNAVLTYYFPEIF